MEHLKLEKLLSIREKGHGGEFVSISSKELKLYSILDFYRRYSKVNYGFIFLYTCRSELESTSYSDLRLRFLNQGMRMETLNNSQISRIWGNDSFLFSGKLVMVSFEDDLIFNGDNLKNLVRHNNSVFNNKLLGFLFIEGNSIYPYEFFMDLYKSKRAGGSKNLSLLEGSRVSTSLRLHSCIRNSLLNIIIKIILSKKVKENVNI